MRLPLHISLDRTADELEHRMRESIRKDTGIAPSHQEVPVIIFSHSASGAVAFMYGAQYTANREQFEVVLNQMGWKWVRTFQAPTCHASKLRSV